MRDADVCDSHLGRKEGSSRSAAEHGHPVGTGEIMPSDYEKRLEALYEQASNEKDPEKLKQLISEILTVLEAHQHQIPDRGAESSDDK